MADYTSYHDWGASELGRHIASLEKLARLTRNLRNHLDKTAKKLAEERKEATVAYRLATTGVRRPPWRPPVDLKITAELLSVRELATALGVTTTTVRKMVEDGRLPAPAIHGGRQKFSRSAIESWVGTRCGA